MSIWQEQDDHNPLTPTAGCSDVVLKIDCPRLPVDHAAALSESLCTHLPWLKTLTNTGINPVHVAGSQNGWQRPEMDSSEELILSKRTRLRIRIDSAHAQQLIDNLKNTTHSVAGYSLRIKDGHISPVQHSATLFSRYTTYHNIAGSDDDEEAFIAQVISECRKYGYAPTKLLCGRCHHLSTPVGRVTTRSLLLADVPQEYSLLLQDNGLGDLRLMGCGVLIPHKDTGAVN